MPIGDVLPEITLLVGALVVLLAASFLSHARQPLAGGLALGVLAAAAGAVVARLQGPSRLTFSGTFALDAATGWGGLLVLGCAAVTVLLAPGWLRSDRRHGEFYAMLLLSTLGALLLAGAADTLELVMALLLIAVTGTTLAAYHRRWPLAVEAGMKYFLIGALGNVLLLLGVVLLFGLVGTTGYEGTARQLAQGVDRPALVVAVAALVLGIGYEIAVVPVHAWLPDVAEGSPAPAAAFLTVVPKIAATLALARFVALLPEDAVAWRLGVAVLAAATMTVGNLVALRQQDLRRLLGWSTVAQSGYALMAVAVVGRSPRAIPALLFFLVAYAAANLAAFAVVTHLRGRTALHDYRGLLARRPAATLVLAVSLLSLVGIPPLAGFVGKLGLFLATLEGGQAWLAGLAVANTVVSLFYYLRVVARTVFDAPGGPVHVLDRASALAMGATGAATLALGLAAQPLLGAFAGVRLLP